MSANKLSRLENSLIKKENDYILNIIDKIDLNMPATFMMENRLIEGNVVRIDHPKKKVIIFDESNGENMEVPIDYRFQLQSDSYIKFRKTTGIESIYKDYNITFSDIKNSLLRLLNGKGNSEVINTQYFARDGEESNNKILKKIKLRLKLYPNRLQFVPIIGNSRDDFLESYNGNELGIRVTEKMKEELLKKGHLSKIFKIKFNNSDVLYDTILYLDKELNSIRTITLDSLKTKLFSYNEKEVKKLLKGGIVTNSKRKPVKLDLQKAIVTGKLLHELDVYKDMSLNIIELGNKTKKKKAV